MRYKLSTVQLTFGPPATTESPASADAPPSALQDVDVTSLGLVGKVVTLSVPAQDPATCNLLSELRAYVLPVADHPPADAIGYLASSYPYVSSDVSGLQASGGNAQLTLPDVSDPSVVQVVLGFVS
jgi:hypothetical protein